MKRFLAICLLVAFGVLYTPRDFWHDCDSHHTTEKTSKLSFEKKCFACDFDINSALEPVAFIFRVQKYVFASLNLFDIAEANVETITPFSLRGPPQTDFC